MSSEFTFKYSQLTGPERMFFDIHGARPQIASKGMHTIAVGDALVQQIRVAETQPEVTRVVIDLVQAASVTTSQLSNPNRLVLELRSKDAPLPPAQPSVTGGKDLTAPADREESNGSFVAAKPEPRKFELSAAATEGGRERNAAARSGSTHENRGSLEARALACPAVDDAA